MNKDFKVVKGVYPTMITPYKDGKIDEAGVRALVRFYWEKGCDGIFATCQSSEILFLSTEEKAHLTGLVVDEAKKLADSDKSRAPMMIVASGHTSDTIDDQVNELSAVAAKGPDALILISNRLDIANTSDEAWIADAEKLLARLPDDIPLGIYECPKPYKRLLTDKIMKWCIEMGRFYFIKDTCCDAEVIKHRLDVCRGSHLEIFNANSQTLLETLRAGASGYCGVMGNMHPELYVKLFNSDYNTKEASLLQDYLALTSMVETISYPCCAKDFLARFRGIDISTYARSCDENTYTPYQRNIIAQFAELNEYMTKVL